MIKTAIGHIEAFDYALEDWEAYQARFKFYLTANEIEDKKKQHAMFFNICG